MRVGYTAAPLSGSAGQPGLGGHRPAAPAPRTRDRHGASPAVAGHRSVPAPGAVASGLTFLFGAAGCCRLLIAAGRILWESCIKPDGLPLPPLPGECSRFGAPVNVSACVRAVRCVRGGGERPTVPSGATWCGDDGGAVAAERAVGTRSRC